MSLTRRALIARITKETGLSRQQVSGIVRKTFEHIIAALGRGERVQLHNFGVFTVKIRKARVGWNPDYPDRNFTIPAQPAAKFKVSQDLSNEVLKLTPQLSAGAGGPGELS
jgi:nucleoid DNA-binding protein